jgi:integrase
MRPGEVCRLRPADIDTSGEVWLCRPGHHKTSHRGKARTIAIGPRAQAILAEFTPDDPAGYYFSPRRTVAALLADRSDGRVTKCWPSHMRRNASKRKKHPRRRAGDCYHPHSYAVAVARACDAAFPPAKRLQRGTVKTPSGKSRAEAPAEWFARLGPAAVAELKQWQKTHRWHPNQLRHSHATKVRERYGLEAAQAALGHEQADVTQIYAERNVALAAKVAAEVG